MMTSEVACVMDRALVRRRRALKADLKEQQQQMEVEVELLHVMAKAEVMLVLQRAQAHHRTGRAVRRKRAVEVEVVVSMQLQQLPEMKAVLVIAM